MGNHFRTVEDGQDAPAANAPGTASHFAYSSPDEDAQTPLYPQADAGMPEPAAPELDPFAYHPEMPTSQVSPFANVSSPEAPAPGDMAAGHTQAAGAPAGTNAALASIPSIPDPAEPAVGADQAHEVATLNTALESGDFTSVFAPVGESRKKMAHEAGVEPVIVMEHVTKIYPAQPNKPALEDVNLEVYPGEFVFLVGHSGSGKSTLLRTIAGLEPIQGGTISINDQVIDAGKPGTERAGRSDRSSELRTRIGMVFQSYDLFPNKTVLGNITMAPVLVQKRDKSEVEAEAIRLLGRVGLADRKDSWPHELSGGQRQRVAICRALILHPEVLLLDEITAALDPEMVREVLDVVLELAKSGQTMLIVTHEMQFARAIADHIILLDGGRIVEESYDAQAFFEHPQTERAQQFLHTFEFE